MLIDKKLAIDSLISNVNQRLVKYYQNKLNRNLKGMSGDTIHLLAEDEANSAASLSPLTDTFKDKQKLFSSAALDEYAPVVASPAKKLPTRLIKLNDKNSFEVNILHVISPFYTCLKHENFGAYDAMEIDLNKFFETKKDQFVLESVDDIKVLKRARALCCLQ